MIKQAIDEILKAEEQAEKIRQHAVMRVRAMQNQNQIDIENLKEEIANDLKAQIKKMHEGDEDVSVTESIQVDEKQMKERIDKAKKYVLKTLLEGDKV